MENQSRVSLMQRTDLEMSQIIQASVSSYEADMDFWDNSELFPSLEESGNTAFWDVMAAEQGNASPHPILAQRIKKFAGKAKRKIEKGLLNLQPCKTLRNELHSLRRENGGLVGEVVDINTVLCKHKKCIYILSKDLEDQKCRYETEIARLKADLLATRENCRNNHVSLSELEMHKKTITDLEAKLRVQKETKDAEISTLTSTNQDLSVAKAALETEVGFLKQELHLCEVHKINEAEKNLSQHKQIVEEFKKELDIQMKQNEARAKKDQERNAAKMLELKMAFDNLQENMETFDDEVMIVQAEQDEKIAAQEARIQDYAEEVTRLESLRAEYESRAKADQEKNEAKVLELKTAFDNLQQKMETFDDEVMIVQFEQDEKITAQEARIEDYAEEVTRLESDKVELQAKVSSLEHERSVQQKINYSSEREKAHLSTISALRDIITCLEEGKADLQSDFEFVFKQLEDRQMAERDADVDLKMNYSSEREKAHLTTISALRDIIACLEEGKADLQSDFEFVFKQLEDRQMAERDADVDLVKKENERIQKQLVEAQTEILRLSQPAKSNMD